jgi:hypothetical protein
MPLSVPITMAANTARVRLRSVLHQPGESEGVKLQPLRRQGRLLDQVMG